MNGNILRCLVRLCWDGVCQSPCPPSTPGDLGLNSALGCDWTWIYLPALQNCHTAAQCFLKSSQGPISGQEKDTFLACFKSSYCSPELGLDALFRFTEVSGEPQLMNLLQRVCLGLSRLCKQGTTDYWRQGSILAGVQGWPETSCSDLNQDIYLAPVTVVSLSSYTRLCHRTAVPRVQRWNITRSHVNKPDADSLVYCIREIRGRDRFCLYCYDNGIVLFSVA